MKSIAALMVLLALGVIVGRAKLIDDPLLRLCEDALLSNLDETGDYRRMSVSVSTEVLSAKENAQLFSDWSPAIAGGAVERTLVLIRYRGSGGPAGAEGRLARCEVLSVRGEDGDLVDRWLLFRGGLAGGERTPPDPARLG